MADHNEAMRLVDACEGGWLENVDPDECGLEDLLNLIRQQAERIAELEAEVQEQARIIGMGAERELALIAELRALCAQRDAARETVRQQAERITELEKEALAKPFAPDWAGYRQGLEDGKREGQAERDQLRAEVETLKVSLRMGAAAEVARSHEVVGLREEVERLREFFDADRQVNKIMDEVSPGLTSPKGPEYAARVDAAIARRCTAVEAIDAARTHKDTP